VKRYKHSLSNYKLFSCDMGELVPCGITEVLPGDSIQQATNALVRASPLLSPVMHPIQCRIHHWLVPNRLVWDDWESFITGGQDGTAEPVLPYVTPVGLDNAGIAPAYCNPGTLWDHLGLPTMENLGSSATSTQRLSILPFWAYCKIFNDYFRDPNLDVEIEIPTELEGDVSAYDFDNDEAQIWYIIRQRGWDKDFYTSALPFAQRGPAVLMPFDGAFDDVPLIGNPPNTGQTSMVISAITQPGSLNEGLGVQITGDNTVVPDGQLYAKTSDLVPSSNITINDLRRSLAIQRWLENNARGGARYNEQILGHFNVQVPDYRIQRAEYLGGGRQPVVISEVLSTADTAEVPVGDMAGHGLSVGKSSRFTYRCQEHGFVIGILSVVPKPGYSQGLDRMWTRESKYDYAWPELANLGEQEILSKEVFYSFLSGDDAANNTVFGYIPRYAEYKFKQDRIAGDFKTTLAFWHLNRMFTERPTLSPEFVRMIEDPDNEETYRRIFAVQDGTDYLWMQLFHRLTAKRPLPYFGVPMLNG